MRGATETDFFERADMMEVGTAKKDDPADVAKIGYEAMMNGEGDVVTGWHNKVRSREQPEKVVDHQPKRGWKYDCGFCLKPLSRLLHPSQRREE